MTPALLLLSSSWIAGAQQLPPVPPAAAPAPAASAPVAGGPAPAYVSSGHGCSGPNCGPVAPSCGCDPCGSSRKGLFARIGGGGLFARFKKADCGCDPCGNGHHGVAVGGCATPLPHGAAPAPTAAPAGAAPDKMPPPPPPASPKPAANSGASVITIPTPVTPVSGPSTLTGTTNPY